MMNEQKSLAERANELASKTATSPQQWELAGEILDQGMEHPVFGGVSFLWDKIVQAMGDAQKRSQNLRRRGVGRTEDPTLLLSMVVPAMEKYHSEMGTVIKQLRQRLK